MNVLYKYIHRTDSLSNLWLANPNELLLSPIFDYKYIGKVGVKEFVWAREYYLYLAIFRYMDWGSLASRLDSRVLMHTFVHVLFSKILELSFEVLYYKCKVFNNDFNK